MKTFGLIVVSVVFLFFVVGIMEKDRPLTEKEKFENAADECWKEYERKSLTPMEKMALRNNVWKLKELI